MMLVTISAAIVLGHHGQGLGLLVSVMKKILGNATHKKPRGSLILTKALWTQ